MRLQLLDDAVNPAVGTGANHYAANSLASSGKIVLLNVGLDERVAKEGAQRSSIDILLHVLDLDVNIVLTICHDMTVADLVGLLCSTLIERINTIKIDR